MIALLVVYGIFNYASLCRAILFAMHYCPETSFRHYYLYVTTRHRFYFNFFYGMHMHFPSFFSQKSKYHKVIDYLLLETGYIFSRSLYETSKVNKEEIS